MHEEKTYEKLKFASEVESGVVELNCTIDEFEKRCLSECLSDSLTSD